MQDAGPDPRSATTSTEFILLLRCLKAWSGLSYRRIESEAKSNGDILPYSTVATMLRSQNLPREEILAAFARACGCDSQTVEDWLEARRRIAMELVHDGPPIGTGVAGKPMVEPLAEETPPPRACTWRGRRRIRVAGLGAIGLAAAMLTTASVSLPRADRVGGAHTRTASSFPADGWYLVKSADNGKCLDVGSDARWRPIVVAWGCRPANMEQHFHLQQTGIGIYQITSANRQRVKGDPCVTVDSEATGEPIRLRTCVSDAANQRIVLRQAEGTARRYRLLPLHSGHEGRCLVGGRTVKDIVDMAQGACTSKAPAFEFIPHNPTGQP